VFDVAKVRIKSEKWKVKSEKMKKTYKRNVSPPLALFDFFGGANGLSRGF